MVACSQECDLFSSVPWRSVHSRRRCCSLKASTLTVSTVQWLKVRGGAWRGGRSCRLVRQVLACVSICVGGEVWCR